MKYTLYISLAVLFLCFACEDEQPEPDSMPTSIVVICNKNKTDPFLVGEQMAFSITMLTDTSVGIANLTINKGGSEVFSKSDYSSHSASEEFAYETSKADLDSGEVVFNFALTDQEGTTIAEDITIQVAVDFPVVVDQFAPAPGWDLIEEEAVNNSITEKVDILQYEIQLSPFTTKTFWTSLNGSKFYDASSKTIDFFDINLSLESLQNALTDLSPQDTLEVMQTGTGTVLPPLPLIMDIRNGQELILIDFTDAQGTLLGYRKGKN